MKLYFYAYIVGKVLGINAPILVQKYVESSNTIYINDTTKDERKIVTLKISFFNTFNMFIHIFINIFSFCSMWARFDVHSIRKWKSIFSKKNFHRLWLRTQEQFKIFMSEKIHKIKKLLKFIFYHILNNIKWCLFSRAVSEQ